MLWEYSMLLVVITDNGKKVKTNIMLLFIGEIRKTTTPIINPKIIFLYDACSINGLLVKEKIIAKRKYTAITTYNDKAIFW